MSFHVNFDSPRPMNLHFHASKKFNLWEINSPGIRKLIIEKTVGNVNIRK